MKRCYMLIIASVFASGIAYPQTSESIQPITLIEARNGSGPGEFSIMPEEEGPWPGLVIDNQEHIYILDTLNNRLQEYDETGKLVRSIAIPSSSPTTSEERMRDLPALIGIVEAIGFINGSICVLQQRNVADSMHPAPPHLLCLRGDGFVNADHDKDASTILKTLAPAHYNALHARELNEGFAQLGTTEEKFRSRHPLEKSKYIFRILRDKNRNVWSVGNGVRVYSPMGTLIYEKSEPYFITSEFSRRGNLYVMAYFIDSATKYWAIRVTKYSLFGK